MVYMMAQAGASLPEVANLLPVRIHVLAILAFALDLVGRSVRIAALGRGVGHPVRFTTALYAMLAGDGAGAVTPSKAGAEPTKIAVLARDRMDAGTAGAVLVGEMVAEAVLLLPLALLAFLFLPAGRYGALGAVIWAGMVTVSILVLFWVAGLSLREAPGWWQRLNLGSRRWRILRVVARRFRHRSRALLHLRAHTLAVIAIATLIHIVGRLGVLPMLAWGTVEWSGMAALIGWPFLLLYGGALIPTPGGGGAVEAGFAAALGDLLGPTYLAGLLVWWRFYTFYLPALMGGVVLFAGGVYLGREEREAESSESRPSDD